MARKKLVRNQEEIREYPCYSIEQVASYIGVPKRTLRNWVTGYSYKTRNGMKRAKPVITPAASRNNLLSFFNLAEAQVLAATRERKIGLRRIRHTVEYMREELKENRPLLRCVFETSGQDIFLHSMSGKGLRSPLNVSKFGQYGFRSILKKYLSRIERDANGNPTRVYPLKVGAKPGKHVVVIHPFVSAGKPSLVESGIMVEVIWKRKKAGESVRNLAKDFRLKPSEIKAAINYYAA